MHLSLTEAAGSHGWRPQADAAGDTGRLWVKGDQIFVLKSVYQFFKKLTGKEGMGYGDFKLLAMLGAWLGWQMLPVIIILSSFVGAVVGISLIVFKNHQRSQPIPFGPYLATAGWIALLWGAQINQAYLNWLTS